MMKKFLPVFWLLCWTFRAFCAGPTPAPISWDKQQDSLSAVLKQLDKGIYPMIRTSCILEKISEKMLSAQPFFAWRLLYSVAVVDDEIIKSQKHIPADAIPQNQVEFSYTDILLIEKNNVIFKIRNALLLKESGKRSDDGGDLFLYKYGVKWRSIKSRYSRFIQYLGENDTFFVFAQGDLNSLLRIQSLMGLKNGDLVREKILAEALDIRDETNLTSRFAMSEIVRNKENAVLPYLKKEIEKFTASGDAPYQHFVVLFLMNTPEQDAMLCELAKSKDPLILEPLFDAVISGSLQKNEISQEWNKFNPDSDSLKGFTCEKRKSLLPVYERMLSARLGILFATEVLPGFPEGKEILEKGLRKIIETPHSFKEYHVARLKLFDLTNPGEKTVHLSACDSVKMFLMRSGEVIGAGQFVNLEDVQNQQVSFDYETEDRKRIQPYVDALIQAPQTELSIVSGLILALFDTDSRRVNRDYINRVNRVGIEILRALPKEQVRNEIYHLLQYGRDDEERAKIDAVRLKCNL